MTQAGPPEGEQGMDALTVDRALNLAALAELGSPLSVRAHALVLDNFKSFPRKTRIPLRDGFTTVSGPNGSGKSNLIDALQFVLAISSSKGMRAERLTDLISNLGTKPKAGVSLELLCTFAGRSGPTEKVVELTRTVRRKKDRLAEVKYYLNGNVIRLADLRDVLQHLGLPTSGQNFVLQNDVIRLTSMGGITRRQVLDELAGAKEFDHRIDLAENELTASERIAQDTGLVLKELGKRLDQLKKERDQALKYQELTSRKKSLEEDLVILGVTEAEVAVASKEQEREAAETAQAKKQKQLEKLRKEADKARAVLAKIEQELSTKGEGERMDAFRAVESLRARLEATREKSREAETEQANREQARPQLEQAVAGAQQAVKAAGGLTEDIEAQLQEKLGQLQVLSQRFEAAGANLQKEGKDRFARADRIRGLRQHADQLRTHEAELVARDRDLAERFNRGEAERALLAGTVNDGGGRLEEIRHRSVEATKLYRDKREGFAKLDAQRRRLSQQISNLRSGLETISSRVSKSMQELAGARAQREQALMHGGGRALSALRKAGLKGLHDPVANLVTLQRKYAQALEAAAGGRLNWMVVDDEHVVGRAIAILKRQNAGRLSFAPLNRVRGRKPAKRKPRGKGVVGWAIDLAKFDPVYEDVMREVFGDTLVLETFADTKRYIGEYRMVTLEGDTVGRNAIMSGGSRTRGGGLLAAAAQIGEMIEKRERALGELEKQRDTALNALRLAEKELAQVGAQAERERIELAQSETTSASLAVELSRLEESLGPQADRLATLAAEIGAIEEEQRVVTPQLEEVRANLRTVTDEMQNLDEGGSSKAFEELQARAEEIEREMRPLEKEVDRLRQELGQALVEKRGAEAARDAVLAKQAEADRQDQALETRLAQLEATIEVQQAELVAREQALAELSSELMELTRKRNQARESSDQARDKQKSAERDLLALAEKLAELGAVLAELTARATELRTAAEEREIEVPGPEEAPADLGRERTRVTRNLGQVDKEIERLGGVNHLAVEQYEATLHRHEELQEKIAVLTREKEEIQLRIIDLQGKKRLAFLEAFEKVRDAFAETYLELGRGEGRLSLENPKDPFAGGLMIKASPRGKKLARLEAMSGGEKALTALALIFALQEVNPAALFVFDEVDKDLDGVNTKILAAAIKRRANDRQYLVISHHRVLLEHSNQTLGVTARKGFGTQVTGVSIAQPSQPTTSLAEAS